MATVVSGSRFATAVATAALAAGGCAPELRLEPAPVLESAEWSAAAPEGGDVPAAPLGALFASPELAALTERALERNADVRIAEARVAQAAALLRSARQSVLPDVSLSASGSRERQLGSALPDFRQAFAQIDIELDLDLFGKLRAERGAALARTRAAELEGDAVRLAVESDVAAAFVQRAALARRMEILDASIARAVELERIIRVRVEEGAATRVDLGLQSIRLLDLRAERSRLAEALDQTRTALALLAGEEAPSFAVAPGRLGDLARPALAPPPPAVLLAARPDIAAAEALIAAAEGDVRAARASFFPQLSVGLGGVADLLTGSLGRSVTLGSALLAPIFSRGRLEGDFAYASAVQVEAVERYRLAILAALKQTEDARSAIDRSAERARLLDAVVAEAGTTARLANLRYIEGEQDLGSVLDAQDLLTDAEDAQVLAAQEELFARIALYRAAGGSRAGTLAAAPDAPPRLSYRPL
ncbi:MAG TPA: efflux transporter outer membrane subunit [Croceibacterium sp.]|nr:efflux transporter outer membrane subunit [Croceibacterium sp.]